ncbi:dihydrofolate reductase family protein [Algoriphagus sp. CAU 1675]|uniref:dihydrofolate reductase family protein n=1 Tax=Algoriphagus sp. CAU 1675 TaxID=3032597 RepID=UPI0023D9D410|nr:dihydrofolate reductase family protein [Algoriphagus sp. CAU 1675]MDF2159123.1 dihydrofolate reductase family protein [Algoriphagus sp. CAU 1675]
MEKSNKVFIATSLDGYIADSKGGIDWLDTFPEINQVDTGYASFTADIDALVMGRSTFETVCGFDMDWPYQKPVFVLSTTLTSLPEKYQDKAELVKGSLSEILEYIHNRGFFRLYIDGGKTIQSFLKEDLIDELILTIIPVLLGGGTPLFSELTQSLIFECKNTNLFFEKVVQNHFVRKRN